MAQRRKQQEEIEQEVTGGADLRRRQRVILFRNPDGSIDASALSEEEKKTLIPSNEPQETPELVSPAEVGVIVSMLANIEGMLLAGKYDLDKQTAVSACQPKEPALTIICESGAKVLNKYQIMSKWAPEIALISGLVMWQTMNLQILGALAEKKQADEARERQNRPRVVPPAKQAQAAE